MEDLSLETIELYYKNIDLVISGAKRILNQLGAEDHDFEKPDAHLAGLAVTACTHCLQTALSQQEAKLMNEQRTKALADEERARQEQLKIQKWHMGYRD